MIPTRKHKARSRGREFEPGQRVFDFDKIAEQVAGLRRIHSPRPVDLDRAPEWWRHRINAIFGRAERSAWREVTYWLAYDCAGDRVLDHFGFSTDAAGRQVFVSEPFADFPKPRLRQAVAGIADALWVHFHILGMDDSWHFPGRTARIEFSECWHTPTCAGCLTQIELRERCRAGRRSAGAK